MDDLFGVGQFCRSIHRSVRHSLGHYARLYRHRLKDNTSLTVVAPGIAEALLATAVGLVAAIPATAAYNKFSTELGRYGARLDNFANDFMATLSRNMEEH